jgi:hypothetical protein
MGPRARLPRLEPGDRPRRFGGPGDETVRSLEDIALAEAAGLLRSRRRLATRAVAVADVHRHWIPCAPISLLGPLSNNPLFRAGHGHTDRRGFTPGELGRLGGRAGFMRVRVRRHVPFRPSLVGLL